MIASVMANAAIFGNPDETIIPRVNRAQSEGEKWAASFAESLIGSSKTIAGALPELDFTPTRFGGFFYF